jgi:hypothetical protein
MILQYNAKVYLLRLMRDYVGLVMLAGCTKSRLLAFYWSAGFGTFHHVSALVSRWLEDWQIVRHLVQYKQVTSHSTFINAEFCSTFY